jgi:hypothetical protein
MTILGQYTVAELEDLIAAKDYAVNQLSYAYFGDAGKHDLHKDPTWPTDFTALSIRYNNAKTKAQNLISALKVSNPLIPNNVIPADAPYKSILKSLRASPNTISKGDLQDLSNRLAALGIQTDYSAMPQPKSGSDIELSAFKAANVALAPLEHPIPSPTKHPTLWIVGILGLVAGYFGVRAVGRVAAPVARAYISKTPVGMAMNLFSSRDNMQKELARRAGVELPEKDEK